MGRVLYALVVIGCVICCGPRSAPAAEMGMSHQHGGSQGMDCPEARLACASVATPTFAPDGTLWVAWEAGGRVMVARSTDRGHGFARPAAVTPAPVMLDTGPDSRPQIVVDRSGRIVVSYAIFKDKAYNGQVFVARSTDGGASFSAPRPITDDSSSQRFDALALDSDGRLFAAWLDKRSAFAARGAGREYVGAALAYAWSSDGGVTFAAAHIAQENTCECCRLGVGFAAPGRPVVLFRNVFGGTVRDHAVITFLDPHTPGPVQRVSVDDWKTDVCPHQGPSLAVSPAGTYHVTWFTNGTLRQGLFYARSTDGGRTFSQPMPIGQKERAPSRPYLAATQDALWLVWKEFDGESTTVSAMVSHDDGRAWSPPEVVAQTADASDHPLVAMNGKLAYLSWQTKREGYRLIELRDAP
jgi:hypothetical protein